jgi:hypothetical protein
MRPFRGSPLAPPHAGLARRRRHSEPEGNLPAKIPATGLLISVYLPDALALRFGEGGGDRQEQLGQAVARDVAAEIEQTQSDSGLPSNLYFTLSGWCLDKLMFAFAAIGCQRAKV